MSIISPRLVIRISLPICLCPRTLRIKNCFTTPSRIPFIREESMIIFLDCFNPRFMLRSNFAFFHAPNLSHNQKNFNPTKTLALLKTNP